MIVDIKFKIVVIFRGIVEKENILLKVSLNNLKIDIFGWFWYCGFFFI